MGRSDRRMVEMVLESHTLPGLSWVMTQTAAVIWLAVPSMAFAIRQLGRFRSAAICFRESFASSLGENDVSVSTALPPKSMNGYEGLWSYRIQARRTFAGTRCTGLKFTSSFTIGS
jgi:hypothetical protein